jgi:glucokinase
MDKIVLAVDLGGTNLRMAAVGAGGEVVARSKSATPRSNDPRDIVEAIIASARDCHDPGAPGYDIQAIGIAIPAMSIGEGGVVNKAANLPSLDGFALAPAVAEKLGVPAMLENDANAAAIGENWIGASRGIANSICVTLGTGVGGGIILNGSTLRGPDWSAGEIGHICVEPLGPPCGCGSNGCVEQYSSATAIVRMAREIMGNYPASELHGKSELSAFDVYEAGKSGDELAGEVFRLMGQYLGTALAGLINVLNPEVIVIGGGVAAGWDLFIGHVRDEIEKRAYCEPAKRAKLVRALLGDDAGILGAARVAFGSGR